MGPPDERKRRLMVRIGRHLPCNPRHILEAFGGTILKVIDNVLSNPNEIKFRELRYSNATVQNKILAVHGGRECLALLGFERITKHNEPHYFLAEPDQALLQEARKWLELQVAEALKAENASKAEASSCADAVIRIELTSGKTLDGGFGANEPVQAVYDFVHSSVVDGEEEVVLRLPPATDLTGEQRTKQTLREAGLVPQAHLVVVKPTGPAGGGIPAAAGSPKAEERKAAEELHKLQALHESQRKREAVEKEKVLQKFKTDREAQHHREEQEAAAAAAADMGVEETKGGRH